MASSNPLISVIIPVYNVEKYVAECLESVCAQTYRKLEIIIVNDGSTDGSREICSGFIEKDSRIRIIDQENGGLSAARNTGLEAASGNYILFIDSDDVVSKNHIELLYSAIASQGTDIAITVMTPFEGSYTNPECVSNNVLRMSSSAAVREMLYQGSFDSCAQSKLYLSDLWEGIRFPVGYLHEDLPTTFKVVLRTPDVSYFDSNTYGYRRNQEGINWATTTSSKIKTLDLVDDMVIFLEGVDDELGRAARCLRTSFCFHLLLHATKSSISRLERKRLQDAIKNDRRIVLSDRNARPKTRIACALSYLGFSCVSLAFHVGHKSAIGAQR